MKKEMIIVSVILVIIVVLNIICKKYMDRSVEDMNYKLEHLITLAKLDLKNTTTDDYEQIRNESQEISRRWSLYNRILSFYIEHDELEKVDTSMVTFNSNLELSKYDEAIPEIDKCIFILNHIKEKELIKITNLF